MPPVNWAGTVHHGLPENLLPFTRRPKGEYLAFLGRISPEKRPDRAIEIAGRAGSSSRSPPRSTRSNRPIGTRIEPMVARIPMSSSSARLTSTGKRTFLGNARALLFPIDWPEPFGLVMIEAMACGIPVIAFGNGSVPEVIDDGVTGFIVNGIDEAVAAVRSVEKLDRAEVRATFEERFTAERMARDYLAIIVASRVCATPKSAIPAAANGVSHGVGGDIDLQVIA